MDIELRDYLVTPGRLDDWIRGWSEGIMPIRKRCGFHLLGAWLDRAQDRFVWVLGYDGPDRIEAAHERYHSMAERRALDPEPSSFLRAGRITRVTPIAESFGELGDEVAGPGAQLPPPICSHSGMTVRPGVRH